MKLGEEYIGLVRREHLSQRSCFRGYCDNAVVPVEALVASALLTLELEELGLLSHLRKVLARRE